MMGNHWYVYGYRVCVWVKGVGGGGMYVLVVTVVLASRVFCFKFANEIECVVLLSIWCLFWIQLNLLLKQFYMLLC